ncbi:DsbA family oxidoreductase [Pseudoalteromonas sp. KG3]|uniref:DsbA family oxidoreductase n=1 Tax=Pseudoalteromonas prydzensis TaxID=182141 RepID=A0ABR9FGJ6_9GAMM|nr:MULTISPECIES: DsbA family oxidoreductase [Pseudoalteromonas]MBE0456065.1 DsbA family oxidoreductase [Pseudoalteromonas prydzensis]WKD25832.1 DsbA family oxidoreductase [Pseudoalteromonas sp. KG3]|eukprot:TRINITY_DN15628_c0_g2_i1.p1 TRINITY_DN15628_c0_g2~~TRINITY_DN15628_c0_g2_i1.p1  ORF type:complete len:219 (+),score=65.56 TRINITY_DN15628_c0_g2_i1:384-1040(+)
MKKLKIDIVSDVMCPWCIIGYKNLETALAQLSDEFTAQISWKPFELNPDMPVAGQDLNEHLAQKYGLTEQQGDENRQRILEMGEQAGFDFNFDGKRIMINSFDLHRLLTWAASEGKQTELKLAFFKAHFTDLVYLNEQDTLLDVVASVGLDRARAKQILDSGEYFQDVRSEQNTLQQMGITSVPTFIINDQFALTGGQPSDAFVQAFKQIAEQEAQQQ